MTTYSVTPTQAYTYLTALPLWLGLPLAILIGVVVAYAIVDICDRLGLVYRAPQTMGPERIWSVDDPWREVERRDLRRQVIPRRLADIREVRTGPLARRMHRRRDVRVHR